MIRNWYNQIPYHYGWSLWPIFHSPLNLPFILKTVWCMNIILSDYESVWHNIWPRNKYRSQWPIFNGPVISLLLFLALKNILVLLAKPDSGELRCPATALINFLIKTLKHKICCISFNDCEWCFLRLTMRLMMFCSFKQFCIVEIWIFLKN